MMKQGWNILKLSDACTLTMGQSPISESYNTDGDGLPFFQGCSDFGKINPTIRTYCNAPTKIAEANDVLMSVRAPIGTLNIANVKCCIGRGLASFRATSRTTNSYLYYFLKHSRTKLESLGTGSTFKAIGKDALSKFPIPVPSIEEQKAICSLLDNLNLVIEKKKVQIAELDKLVQSLFYDMFGDPINNPQGWEVKQFGEECTELRYGTSRPACENGQYKYLRMGNLTTSGHLDLTDLKTIDIPESEVDKCLVKYGDVLFNRTNSLDLIGKTCMFDLEEPMIIAGYIIRVRLSDRLTPRYVSVAFNMPSMKNLLRKMAKGAVNQANINSKELASIRIPVPPLPLQQAFAEKVKAIERQKELINQSIHEMQTLFDSRMEWWFGE